MARLAEHVRPVGAGAFTPVPYRVEARQELTDDVVTLALSPLGGAARSFLPGQFDMLTAFGVGEVAVSISSDPDDGALLEHTIRDVGPVTHALCHAPVGAVLGVRGPFGTDWGVDELAGDDVVVVAGGIGLAPLRGALCALARTAAARGGRLAVVVGARSPSQVVFADDLRRWRDSGAEVQVTVDVAEPGWRGHVGLVTSLVPEIGFDLRRAAALVCGPEVMMRFTVRALVDRGMAPERIRLSLERNMQCGVGLCGHCQLGPYLLCRDGPVLPFAGPLPGLLLERER